MISKIPKKIGLFFVGSYPWILAKNPQKYPFLGKSGVFGQFFHTVIPKTPKRGGGRVWGIAVAARLARPRKSAAASSLEMCNAAPKMGARRGIAVPGGDVSPLPSVLVSSRAHFRSRIAHFFAAAADSTGLARRGPKSLVPSVFRACPHASASRWLAATSAFGRPGRARCALSRPYGPKYKTAASRLSAHFVCTVSDLSARDARCYAPGCGKHLLPRFSR